MDREPLRPDDGGRPSSPLQRPIATPPLAPHEIEPPSSDLGTVVRDAIDTVTEIARDAVALARIEAQRAASVVATRIAWRAMAAVLALVGVVLLLIAVFIGLGTFIPSVGWRLFIYAVVFLCLAVAGLVASLKAPVEKHRVAVPGVRGVPAGPGVRGVPAGPELRREEPKRLSGLHPIEGIGD